MKYQVEIITKTPKTIIESSHPLKIVKELFYDQREYDRETREWKVVRKQTHSIRYKVTNLKTGSIFTGEFCDFKLCRDDSVIMGRNKK